MKNIVLSLIALCAAAHLSAQQAPGSRVIEASYKSGILGVEKSYCIYLPAEYDAHPDKKFPVLYLLHGSGDTHTWWSGVGNMRLIADEHIEAGMCLPMIVVMPNAQGQDENRVGKNLGYFNQEGWAYEDQFFNEFIPHIEKTYRIIGDKKHRAITGQSMGGAGSSAYALRHPEFFGSCCPMSGSMSSRVGNPLDEARGATPRQIEGMRSIRWYIECGDDDRLLGASIDFYNTLRGHGVPHVQLRVRNGGHNWEYWRGMLPTVLTFVSVGFSE